jgi:hypothetical protein
MTDTTRILHALWTALMQSEHGDPMIVTDDAGDDVPELAGVTGWTLAHTSDGWEICEEDGYTYASGSTPEQLICHCLEGDSDALVAAVRAYDRAMR